MPLYVSAVLPRKDGRTYLVIDSELTKYTTTDVWLASLAQSYQKSQVPVRIDSGAGWHYRNLSFVSPEEPMSTAEDYRPCLNCGAPTDGTVCDEACARQLKDEAEAKAIAEGTHWSVVKPTLQSSDGVPLRCTCLHGTSQWVYVAAQTQRCRRCGAVRSK